MTWVAISGTHGVGKTTAIDAAVAGLSERPPVVLGGIMRQLAATGLGVGVESTLATMAAYVREQFNMEDKAVGEPAVVSGRVLIDGLAYVRAAIDAGHNTYPWRDEEIELLREVARRQIRSYTVHAVVPIEFPLQNADSFHRYGEPFRVAVEGVLREELREWPVPVAELRGTVDERATMLVKLLEGDV